MANWKYVGNPYWDGYVLKIDCVATGLLPDKSYHARGYCGVELVSSHKLTDDVDNTSPERSCTLRFLEGAVDRWCSPLPFTVEVVLTEGWTVKDSVTRTIPEREPTITCDAPTPHFPSGCALLLHYDANGDGLIDKLEATHATDDYNAGIITKEEAVFVVKVYFFEGGKINNKCSGCYVAPPAHDTALSIAVTDEAGNPITESAVGETVYITGQLRDIVDNVALQGASITLYRNGVATSKTDVTNPSGIYSIPYTVTKADAGLLKFKTYFAGT